MRPGPSRPQTVAQNKLPTVAFQLVAKGPPSPFCCDLAVDSKKEEAASRSPHESPFRSSSRITLKVGKEVFDFLWRLDVFVLEQAANQLVTERLAREGQQNKKKKSNTSLAEPAARVSGREAGKRRKAGSPVAIVPVDGKTQESKVKTETQSDDQDQEVALALATKITKKPVLRGLLAEQILHLIKCPKCSLSPKQT